MKLSLKPLDRQVIVITGASSGIGAATARLAARRGAKVVLAARSENALATLADFIRREGGTALPVVCDVASADDVRRLARTAVERFGAIDTWVNDAAVAVYGTAEQVPLEEARRLFDVNYWGTVHGSLEAVRHFRGRPGSGKLINVGSVESDRALPYHSAYAASKHAIKAFTDTLRMEAEKEGLPVSVTLIKPGSINTPFVHHAKNYLDREPSYPPPVYDPYVVARAILTAATGTHRDIIVGGGGKMISSMASTPRLADFIQRALHFRQQKSSRPAEVPDRHNLYAGAEDLREHGDYEGHVMRSSAYTAAATHPAVTLAVLTAATAAIAGITMAMRPGRGVGAAGASRAPRGTNAPLPKGSRPAPPDPARYSDSPTLAGSSPAAGGTPTVR